MIEEWLARWLHTDYSVFYAVIVCGAIYAYWLKRKIASMERNLYLLRQ